MTITNFSLINPTLVLTTEVISTVTYDVGTYTFTDADKAIWDFILPTLTADFMTISNGVNTLDIIPIFANGIPLLDTLTTIIFKVVQGGPKPMPKIIFAK